ncbi:MAG TPA: methyltransferase [Candidatus Nanoarchaeia archaeon]|nr:methyltransferase [Candidatus Nanoarchaeia archaeon]
MKRIEEIAKEAGIEHKEIEEGRCFYRQVKKSLSQISASYSQLDNFFCGNNLTTWFWLADDLNLDSLSCDINLTNKSRRLREKIKECFPELESRNKFVKTDLTSSWLEEEEEGGRKSLAIAIHACGNLSDIFIKNCTARRIPFAIVPCCHKKDSFVLSPANYPYGLRYEDYAFDFYQDRIRAKYAEEKGYDIFFESLPIKTTAKNRIILGVPQDDFYR